MAGVDQKDVEEIALLARLSLTAEEIERLRRDLGSILEYIDALRELDTGGVEPMTHAVPLDCPLREDVAQGSLPVDEALAAAPRRDGDLFAVPHILQGVSDPSPGKAGRASPGSGKDS
jgi:aspartyl-tRNA(Asn)/glutamyl-tRNA(Gln) amidotransferase subunit C